MMKYTWRRDCVEVYESLWSILNKFAYLNNGSHKDLYKIFGDDEINSLRVAPKSRSTLQFNGVDKQALKCTLNLSDEIIKYCVVDAFTLNLGCYEDYFSQRYFKYLRFCPLCLQLGFHTPMFQCAHIHSCPLHQCKIEDACPQCGNSISMVLSPESLKNPYGCLCGYRLTDYFDIGFEYPHVPLRPYIEKFISRKESLEQMCHGSEPIEHLLEYPLYNYFPSSITLTSNQHCNKKLRKLSEKQMIGGYPNGLTYLHPTKRKSWATKLSPYIGKTANTITFETNESIHSEWQAYPFIKQAGSGELWRDQIIDETYFEHQVDEYKSDIDGFKERAGEFIAIFKSVKRYLKRYTHRVYKECFLDTHHKKQERIEHKRRYCKQYCPISKVFTNWEEAWLGFCPNNLMYSNLWGQHRPLPLVFYVMERGIRYLTHSIARSDINKHELISATQISAWVYQKLFADLLMRSFEAQFVMRSDRYHQEDRMVEIYQLNNRSKVFLNIDDASHELTLTLFPDKNHNFELIRYSPALEQKWVRNQAGHLNIFVVCKEMGI